MATSSPLNFANQDLRNRSFRSQNLSGADFSGADIRGCDFRDAILNEANLAGVRTGQSRRQIILLVVFAVAVGLFVGDPVTRLVFSSVDQTPENRTWGFVVVLYVVLCLAGAGMALKAMVKSNLGKFAGTFSGMLSGALLGFYYAGIFSDKNPQIAVAGAVTGALVMLFATSLLKSKVLSIAIATGGTVAAYGTAFLIAAKASACFSTKSFIWGIILSLLSLIYIWFTMRCFSLVVREIRTAVGTSFQGANLKNANFDNARLENTDFAQTLGYLDED
jgi:uncharacterized protein YjbI with pentapeptide repeats